MKDTMKQLINTTTADLRKKVDDAIIEGLRRKGFEFDNPYDLEVFIKSRCICEDHVGKKQRTYFVDGRPFFLHNYEGDALMVFDKPIDTNTYKFNCGSFAYL